MLRIDDDRARWLKRNVLPYEAGIRSWLRQRAVYDLDIDDVIQEMYAKLVALDSVEEIRDPRNYAYRTAYSIVASHVRHARIVPIRSTGDLDYFGIATSEATAEEVLDFREQLNGLGAILDTLPAQCRKAFLLRRVDGLSQRETAEHLGVTEKSVEKHMTRALKLLMDTFGRGGRSQTRASNAPKKTASGND
jgi:RNA polymerase sigma factor (sigma-70 family)